MLSYFDYIFYRIYSFYVKKGDSTPIVMTLNFIFVLQMAIVFDIAMFFLKFERIPSSSINKEYGVIIAGLILSALYLTNTLRYIPKKYYLEIVRKNSENRLNSKIKTWMLFIQPPILVILVFFFI